MIRRIGESHLSTARRLAEGVAEGPDGPRWPTALELATARQHLDRSRAELATYNPSPPHLRGVGSTNRHWQHQGEAHRQQVAERNARDLLDSYQMLGEAHRILEKAVADYLAILRAPFENPEAA